MQDSNLNYLMQRFFDFKEVIQKNTDQIQDASASSSNVDAFLTKNSSHLGVSSNNKTIPPLQSPVAIPNLSQQTFTASTAPVPIALAQQHIRQTHPSTLSQADPITEPVEPKKRGKVAVIEMADMMEKKMNGVSNFVVKQHASVLKSLLYPHQRNLLNGKNQMLLHHKRWKRKRIWNSSNINRHPSNCS